MMARLKAFLMAAVHWVLGNATAPAPVVQPPENPEVLPFDPTAMVVRHCLNGPCQGAEVHTPMNATPGNACALGWENAQGQLRYAVYVLVDWNGAQGLMYLKSYDRPEYAQAKVHKLTAICAQGMA